MKFSFPIVEGILLKREKRFLSYVKLKNGEEVIAHCANPGSMKGNAVPGSPVWLLDFGPDHVKSGKKLRYKWLFVVSDGIKVCVDTSLANPIVEEALKAKQIPALAAYEEVQREFTVGDSRFDFVLRARAEKLPDTLVEVKSVSMGEGKLGSFPDSITKRGQKHVLGLGELAQKKKRAVLLFMNMREGGNAVTTAKDIDPEYDKVLRKAMQRGMQVLVYGIKIRGDEITLGPKGELKLK